jgi:hypothetical protein
MPNIQKCAVPPDSLLAAYSSNGYVDSYRTEFNGHVSLAKFIASFYTTSLFKLERFILKHVARKPSTDTQVQDLADGKANQLAAWTVEKRNDHEILMCDMLGRTRSWLMVQHANENTTLYFGSAVVPGENKSGKSSLGFIFTSLLGFHKIYSVLLLSFAKRNIR